jgi:hypothetical protein
MTKDEVPDHLPEGFGADAAAAFDPTQADLQAVADQVARAILGLQNAMVPLELIDAGLISVVLERAHWRARDRGPGYAFGSPVMAPPGKGPMDKWVEALLGDATDEEILAMAKQARSQIRSMNESEKWKDGKGD